jgi:hypothetical protein
MHGFRHMDLMNIPYLVTGPAKHMGYHDLKRYGLLVIRELRVMLEISHIPTWETEFTMGY